MLPARPFALRAARQLPLLLAARPVSRRAFFPFRRRPDTADSLRIRMQRPSRARSRLITAACILLPVLLAQLFVKVEVVRAEDDEALMKQKRVLKDDLAGGEDEHEEDSGLFIPIWWPYEAEPVYYKGTDPEWQEFIKFAKDGTRKAEVLNRLGYQVRHLLNKDAKITEEIGEWTLGKREHHWLIAEYPEGPPPDYLLLGIYFDLPVISLAEQRLSNEEYRRFQAVMQPNMARYVYNTVWQKLAGLVLQHRWPDWFGPPPEQTRVGAQSHDTAHANDGPQPEGSAPRAQAEAAGESQGGGSGSDKHAAENRAGDEGEWMPDFLMRYAYSVAELTRHNYHRFRASAEARELRRGQLLVTGIVEAKCARGFALLDVRAHYDPVSDNITFISVAPRTIKVYDQRPRG